MIERYRPKTDYYVYALFRYDTGDVFYIGKGRGRRYRLSSYVNLSKRNLSWKEKILAQAKRAGQETPVVLIRTGLTNAEACVVEQALIVATGRYPNGPLVNLTDGGEGNANHSARTKAKRVASLRRVRHLIFNEETNQKRSSTLKGRIVPEEVRAKISASLTGFIWSREVVAKRANTISKVMTGKPRAKQTQKQREQRSRAMKAYWKANPDKLEKFTRRGVKLSGETRAKMRTARLLWWQKQ